MEHTTSRPKNLAVSSRNALCKKTCALEKNLDVIKMVINAKDPEAIINVFEMGKDYWNDNKVLQQVKKDLRQAIIDIGNPEHAFSFIKISSATGDIDAELRQIIIDAKDPDLACRYCKEVSNDLLVRQVIIDSGDLHWACEHLRRQLA